MKIAVLDGYCLNPGDLSWDALRRLGEVEVTTMDGIVENIEFRLPGELRNPVAEAV